MPSRQFAVFHHSEPVLRIGPPVRPSIVAGRPPSANERFKGSFLPALRVGVLIALPVHFAVFALTPNFESAAVSATDGTLAAIELPPTVKIPAPPEPVARPATPKLAALDLSEDVTIAPTTFEAFDTSVIGDLTPPPVVTDPDGKPEFISYEVAPRLENKAETIALLQRVYPGPLKNAGVDGRVRLWIYIDEKGIVRECRVAESSGYVDLDEAATTVAHAMRFSPAYTLDKAHPVWISQPIDFISN